MSKARQLADLGNVYDDGALSNRNMVVNGAMVIDQRNSGSSITPTAWTYSVDRFRAEISQASKLSVQQNAGSVTPPVGFSDYLGVTSLSSYTLVTGDYFYINTQVEGYNSAQLGWGASGAKDATLSFWVRSSLTGSHSGALRNGGNTRSYPFTFTVSTANTWEHKTVTIEGDISGTWATDNTSGVQISFSLGGGTTFRGAASAWASADYRAGVTGAVDIVGTNGATFYITGVQLEVGDTATPFEHRSYGDELARCERYYQQWTAGGTTPYLATGRNHSSTQSIFSLTYRTEMRGRPTLYISSTSDIRVYDGNDRTCTGITLNGNAFNTCGFNVTGLSSGVGNNYVAQAYFISTSGYFALDAEL
jgi:hypothetical protein